jgi:flagellar hook assembly protein FlgD
VFRFAVPQATQVKLEVYDLAGRHVRTLVDGLVQAGWQTARWDGRSDAGARVASGVYFCRLEAGTRELSRKVVVLK